MTYKFLYKTPEGFSDVVLTSDGENLTGLWFEGTRDSSAHTTDCEERELAIFRETIRWLDIYFGGRAPNFTPPYKITDLSPFRQAVIDAMNAIPFGGTLSYGDIAKTIAGEEGRTRMSAQAVGGAVGWNPICLIIPCHRVVGVNGNLTGYGGGLQNKIALLRHEGNDMTKFFLPREKQNKARDILL